MNIESRNYIMTKYVHIYAEKISFFPFMSVKKRAPGVSFKKWTFIGILYIKYIDIPVIICIQCYIIHEEQKNIYTVW